jgi:DNA-binding transcriptional regulator GbsR (MarR family)
MPGGRLTLVERQQVAVGLADRLSYAEIARRLGRPTSTVSRDVARNGGPADYRAEAADQATRGRARRTTPHPPGASAPSGRDAAAVREVEERFTALIVRTGLSRMTARVLACLYTADSGSHTAAELVQRLRVSPASVSKAIGELEAQQLVRREPDPHRRRDRYVIDGDLWYQSWLASARMNAALADTARYGAEVLGTATPAGARLDDMSRFLAQVGDDMVRAAERWYASLD